MQTMNRDTIEDKLERNEELMILDLSSPEEYAKDHLPRAVNVPADSEDFIEKVMKKIYVNDIQVIYYCVNDDLKTLEDIGEKFRAGYFKKAYAYVEGKEGWKKAGLKTVS